MTDRAAYRAEIASWSDDTLAAILLDQGIQAAGKIVPTICDLMNEAGRRLIAASRCPHEHASVG